MISGANDAKIVEVVHKSLLHAIVILVIEVILHNFFAIIINFVAMDQATCEMMEIGCLCCILSVQNFSICSMIKTNCEIILFIL